MGAAESQNEIEISKFESKIKTIKGALDDMKQQNSEKAKNIVELKELVERLRRENKKLHSNLEFIKARFTSLDEFVDSTVDAIDAKPEKKVWQASGESDEDDMETSSGVHSDDTLESGDELCK